MELNPIPPVTSAEIEEAAENANLHSEKENVPRMSCCYGFMVFLGLAISLVTLTMLVIYAGVWSQQSLYDDHLITVIGGEVEGGKPLADTEILPLPQSDNKPDCKDIKNLPVTVTGAVGTLLKKHLTLCGGDITISNFSATSDCYRFSPENGWLRFSALSKPRAYAAAAWIPKRGWWITGGVNDDEPEGISTTDLYSISSNYGESESYDIEDTFMSGPVMPEGVSHHCLIKLSSSTNFLMIGGITTTDHFSAKVWEYDWSQRQWSSMAPLYEGRHSHSCALVNDGEFVIVAGGLTPLASSPQLGGSTSAEMLELATSTWHKLPAMPKPFFGAVAAKLDPGSPHGSGPLAFVGGTFSHGTMMHFVKRGLFETGKSSEEEPIAIPRRYAVVLVANPRLICG